MLSKVVKHQAWESMASGWNHILWRNLEQLKYEIIEKPRVSVQGDESLWGDCRFVPADWGS